MSKMKNTISYCNFLTILVMLSACHSSLTPSSRAASQPKVQVQASSTSKANIPAGHEVALFAGGCFWCMEKPFDVLDGVVSTISGYTDGHVENPSYKAVSRGATGHTEVVEIVFDPKKITYAKLLDIFWRNIDPTVENRQFCDRGSQYRSGIYFKNEQQEVDALASLEKIKKVITGKIYTEIKAASVFYPAEEYHQDFYKKKPGHYSRYRLGCGRDRRLRQLWGVEAH